MPVNLKKKGTALSDGVDPGNGSDPAGANNPTVSGLVAGTYTVEVVDNLGTGLGCSSTATIVLTDNTPTITVGAATNTGASNCANLNDGNYNIC